MREALHDMTLELNRDYFRADTKHPANYDINNVIQHGSGYVVMFTRRYCSFTGASVTEHRVATFKEQQGRWFKVNDSMV